jgi:hypothetical protein
MWDSALTPTNYTDWHAGTVSMQDLGADHRWLPGTSGTDLGDVGGIDLARTDVGTVPW